MAGPIDVNYPDVLGYITNGARHVSDVVQVALATRPRVVRAGRPFEVVMVVQNTVDVAVEVTVTLNLPETDTEHKKGRFVTSTERLVIDMQPGEVGLIKLPVSTLPDTAVSNEYSAAMDIKVKTGEKPKARLRRPDGGGPVKLEVLKPDAAQLIEELQKLAFSTAKKGGGWLRGGDVIETQFGVMAGKVGQIADLKPGWVSLWTMDDLDDDSMLVQRYKEMLRLRVLPELRRDNLLGPMQALTKKRFAEAGYPLLDAEVPFIAKLLTIVLEYAHAAEAGHAIYAAGKYNLDMWIAEKPVDLGMEVKMVLPRWTATMLRAIARDERVGSVPVKAVLHFAYYDLVFDACEYAFSLIETATGEDLGTPEEVAQFSDSVVAKLKDGGIDFTHTYMPLLMGGVLVGDQVLVKGERISDMFQALRDAFDQRQNEWDDDNEPVFQMTRQVIDQMLKKYGYDQ
jgi:hypothetical protein